VEAPDTALLTLIGYGSLSLLAAGLMQLANLNSTLFIAINHSSAAYAPDAVFAAITMFGEGLWQMALIAPLLLVAPRVNVAALYAAPVALLVTHVPKLFFHMPRPSSVLAHHGVHLIDAPMAMNTFPSGHAVMAGMIATVVILGFEVVRRRMWVALLVLSLSWLVSWSRIAVGAHWPADVLVGAALGVAAGWAGNELAERFYRPSGRATLIVAGIYVAGAIALAFTRTHHPQEELLRVILVVTGLASALAAIVRAQIAGATRHSSRTKAESQARAFTT